MDAVGQLTAIAGFPQAEAIAALQDAHFPASSADDDYDDLYGDVNLGFLPLPPPSPSPTSPPKTPSPGLPVASPSPPPRRTPPPKPQPDPESEPQPKPTPQHRPPLPAPKPPTPQHQPPLPMPKPPAPRHQPPPLRALSGSTSSSLSPPTTALYIGDLPWWTTDAEVEAVLAPHGALQGLHFYADKYNGKSRGFCRADFLHPAAAASAAAALHGRAFHRHHCVASLSCPPALHRPGSDFDAPALAPAANPTLGGGGNASNLTTARGNVGLLGDQPGLVPLPRPMAPRPHAFGVMMGGGRGYGGFPSVGQCNAGMGTDMMSSVVAPHVNPAFLAASRMAMGGTGVWHDQGMAGGLWGGQQPWNFRGREISWQQPRLQQHHRRTQQQYRNGNYGKPRGTSRERPGGRNEERDIGNVRGNPDRRQCGRGSGERPKEHNREERARYREHVLEKERERERCCDERDRHGGEKRRHQGYNEHDDWETRGRARSRSQSRNSDDDDNPRRRR